MLLFELDTIGVMEYLVYVIVEAHQVELISYNK